MIVSCMYYRGDSAAVSPALAADSQYLNKTSLPITGKRVIQLTVFKRTSRTEPLLPSSMPYNI